MRTTELILVRHGESTGNLAREAALADGAEVIPVDRRDPDVPLSDVGRAQAAAVGHWLGANAEPDVVWSSPYVRAVETATIALQTAGRGAAIRVDERLRDRELGILDRLTGHGVETRFPDEAERRRYLGKMYYRPPGGESWADVALRLRSFLGDRLSGRRLLIFSHDAIILLFRYILDELSEAELLDVVTQVAMANGSISRFVDDGAGWRVAAFNDVEHLDEVGVRPTLHEGRQRDAEPR